MSSTMSKIGLALSGGGFRASLYHLGLIRFLRDAGILSQVSHITSVSGGSIFAAHLVLNWDRYNGAPSEFNAVASEFLDFVRLDVRNRIVRRYLLNLPLLWPRRLLGFSNRRLTRTGLLEGHYQKYLFGDVSLFELPEKPQLHLLATNLRGGCLCSFNRNGLLMVRPQPRNTFRIDRIHIGLATVAMAVTASSAFPGFFAPLELTGADVGESVGEFGRHTYTDGGVFDNLGVRMFRCLERPLLADGPLTREDFFDLAAVTEALRQASESNNETPLRRIAQVLVATGSRPEPFLLPHRGAPSNVPPPSAGSDNGDATDVVASRLWHAMREYQFHCDPLFTELIPEDPEADALLQASRANGRGLDSGEQVWLNRHLIETAFRKAIGQPCFRRLNSGLDGVLVSDVGKPIEIQANRPAGGLIRTALRSTDILMDRVWQLEKAKFEETPGFVFAPITDMVEPVEDPTALHPEIQRQVANIRTDLDRFSPLEISSLVRHGYCVGRKACRAHPQLFGADLPANAPWDPIPASQGAAPPDPGAARLNGPPRVPATTTIEARKLQASAFRRIWSTMLDYRDWVSYIYVPILVPIFILLPYFIYKSYERSRRLSLLVDSLAQGSRDLEKMKYLLDNRSTPWSGELPEEVRNIDEPDLKGFEVLQDSRILDLRSWRPGKSGEKDSQNPVYVYRRLKVIKRPDGTGTDLFRVQLDAISPNTRVRFPEQQIQPRLRMTKLDASIGDQKACRWELSYDFEYVPAGDYTDLFFDFHSPGLYLQRGEKQTTVSCKIQAATGELTVWVLMPEGYEYKKFHIVRHETGKHEKPEDVKVVNEFLADDYTILAFRLMSLKPGYTYEINWAYK
jgi:predicted acylesterase/phospholipase RssA